MNKVKVFSVGIIFLSVIFAFKIGANKNLNKVNKNAIVGDCDCMVLVKAEFLRTNQYNHLDAYDITYRNKCKETIEFKWFDPKGNPAGSRLVLGGQEMKVLNTSWADKRGFNDGRCRIKQ